MDLLKNNIFLKIYRYRSNKNEIHGACLYILNQGRQFEEILQLSTSEGTGSITISALSLKKERSLQNVSRYGTTFHIYIPIFNRFHMIFINYGCPVLTGY